MHYWQSFAIGGFIVTCVVSYSIFIFFWSKGSCPIGTLACSGDENCVPQSKVCNMHQDCPNGEDEEPILCTDLNGSINSINQTLSTSITTLKYHNSILRQCNLTKYPSNCICKLKYRIYCKNTNLIKIPNNISLEVTHLILPNNSIRYLDRENLLVYKNLEVLHLEGNRLTNISNHTFSSQRNMLRLFLTNNNLTVIKNGIFDGLHRLVWLFLCNNNIKKFEMKSIRNLKALQWIDISKNHLTLEHESFPALLNLSELFLGNNNISIIKNNTFSQLINLELINLQKNQIFIIESGSFGNLRNLRELNLHENKLTQLHSSLFRNVPLLSKLYLGSNPFHRFPTEVFNKLENLASLNLDEIDIENIDINIFQNLKKLKSVYFKKYYYCSFAPTVPRCRPLSDGISSTTHLLQKPILRYATWITSIITCIGNILVIWGRCTIRDDNKVLNLVIRNLAVSAIAACIWINNLFYFLDSDHLEGCNRDNLGASYINIPVPMNLRQQTCIILSTRSDLLMGIYLMIIAVKDFKFRGVYNQYAYSWMSSWLCIFSGVLAMTSSEVSILLLAFMSAERFLLISLPFGRFSNMNVKTALTAMITIWILGIGFAVIPTMEFYSSTRFYGLNGLCFPLYIDEPFLVGWKYSAIITFGINTLSLLFIATVYCIMFVSIWKTRNATSLPKTDYEFAIRFFFIVLTDVSCWFPIIIAKLLALSGIEITGDLHSWLVVFVLPINSAVNPLLYTFTTMKYRSKLSVPWSSNDENKHLNNPEGVSRFSPQSNLGEQ